MKWVDDKSQRFMLDRQFTLPTKCPCVTHAPELDRITNDYCLAVQPSNCCMRMTPRVMQWSDTSGYYSPLVWQWCVCSPTAQQNRLEGTALKQQQERIPLDPFNKKTLKLFMVHIVP